MPYDFNEEKLRAYLRQETGQDFSFYLQDANLADLIRDYRKLSENWSAGARVYDSLDFDRTGGALLACENFKRDARRWDGYRNAPVQPSPAAMKDLAELATLARAKGVDLVVAETPMRSIAREKLGIDLVKWRETTERILASAGARFAAAPDAMPDEMFADYAHVNSCGARAWTPSGAEVREL